jgi:DNA-binding transcriptional LysR family regulator
MNLQQIEYFKIIAETKNFSTAAVLASVSQPALSKAISKLETELKVPLFERNGRNIKLTGFGEAFLKHATMALAEIEKGTRELKEMSSPDKGTISIASTYCIGTHFMPFIISDFLSSCPDAKFQFNHESIPDILKNLKEGKIHLGFYDRIDDIHLDDIHLNDEIESIAIKKEEYVLIVSKKHPIANQEEVSLKDLKDESFIVVSEGDKDKKLSHSEFLEYTPKISLKPNQISMLGGLVAAGAGITIVSNTPLINTNRVSIIKIKEDIGHKTIYMGWLKDSYMSPSTEKFRDHVLSSI